MWRVWAKLIALITNQCAMKCTRNRSRSLCEFVTQKICIQSRFDCGKNHASLSWVKATTSTQKGVTSIEFSCCHSTRNSQVNSVLYRFATKYPNSSVSQSFAKILIEIQFFRLGRCLIWCMNSYKSKQWNTNILNVCKQLLYRMIYLPCPIHSLLIVAL